MNTIYTFGYTGTSPESIKEMTANLNLIVLDIRMSPKSRVAYWDKHSLKSLLGNRYEHLRYFGNRNYSSGRVEDIVIENFHMGLHRVFELIKSHNLGLMCACPDVNLCHRLVLADGILNMADIPIVHLSAKDVNRGGLIQPSLF